MGKKARAMALRKNAINLNKGNIKAASQGADESRRVCRAASTFSPPLLGRRALHGQSAHAREAAAASADDIHPVLPSLPPTRGRRLPAKAFPFFVLFSVKFPLWPCIPQSCKIPQDAAAATAIDDLLFFQRA